MLFDFTTLHETGIFKLHDLEVVIYTKDEEDNLHHEFFDFFSEAPRDCNFFYEVFERIDQIGNFLEGVHF